MGGNTAQRAKPISFRISPATCGNRTSPSVHAPKQFFFFYLFVRVKINHGSVCTGRGGDQSLFSASSHTSCTTRCILGVSCLYDRERRDVLQLEEGSGQKMWLFTKRTLAILCWRSIRYKNNIDGLFVVIVQYTNDQARVKKRRG